MVLSTIRKEKIIQLIQIGPTHTEEDYYRGPMVGYTNQEMEMLIGKAVLDLLDANDLQIVWKPR